MITAKEAKAISNRNTSKAKDISNQYNCDVIVEGELANIELNVIGAVDNGYTTIYYNIRYCGDILDRILKSLVDGGYTISNYKNSYYSISWEQPNENRTTPHR